MVIYVDTLVFTNILLDYILLSITSIVVKRSYRLLRLILAAVIGGFSSLYILVQSNSLILDIIFKIGVGALILFIAIGIKNIKIFLFSYIVFLGLSFALNGSVYFLQGILESSMWLSNNLVSYINISPLYLIGITAVIYLSIRFIQRISDRRIKVNTAQLSVSMCGINENYIAMVDSGNSLSDPFSDSQVFILDCKAYDVLLERFKDINLENRQRFIPIKTVENVGLLEAVRCDSAEILADGKRYIYRKPIIAASKAPITAGFNAIIPLSALDRIPDNVY